MDINYKDKKVLVCGAARSGISAALLLNKQGAHVTLQDNKDLDIPMELKNIGINFCFGKDPDDIVIEFDVVVISPGIRYDSSFLIKAREKNIYIIGEFELGSQFYTGSMYAITGTNGKTTTTMLVSHIFNQKQPTNTVGNIGNPITSVGTIDYPCIAEVSSFQLETIDKFAPQVCAVTNLTPDHLDRHFTMENYSNIKSRIFEKQSEKDYVILNFDNNYTKNKAKKAKSNVIYFSIEENFESEKFKSCDNYFIFDREKSNIIGKLHDRNISVNISGYKLVGLHNVENAMVAIIMSLLYGVDIPIIEQGIKSFPPPEHRLEYVNQIKGIKFYNDSKATNPESGIKSIESMLEETIVLIAGGVLKDVDHTDWSNLVLEKVAHTFIIGSDENQYKMIKELNAVGYKNISQTASLKEAVYQAYEKIENGVVLFSPATASFDMFKDYEDRGKQFKEIVMSI